MSTFLKDKNGNILDIDEIRMDLFPCKFKPDDLAMPAQEKPTRAPNKRTSNKRTNKKRQKPPKPMNSFVLFRRAFNFVLKRKELFLEGKNLSRIAGHIWKKAGKEDKEGYEEIAEELKKNHKKDYPNFKEERKRKSRYQFKNLSSVNMKSPSVNVESDDDVNMDHLPSVNVGQSDNVPPANVVVNAQTLNVHSANVESDNVNMDHISSVNVGLDENGIISGISGMYVVDYNNYDNDCPYVMPQPQVIQSTCQQQNDMFIQGDQDAGIPIYFSNPYYYTPTFDENDFFEYQL